MAISPKLLNDGEDVVVSTRTHVKALLVPLLALVLLLALGVAVQVLVDQEVVTLVAWVVAGLGILRFVVWPFLVWLTAHDTWLPDIPRVEETKRRVHLLLHDQATEATARHVGT